MALLKFLRQYHWTIQEHHLSTGKAEGAEKFLVAWGIAIIIVRYLVNCFEALEKLTMQQTELGLAMTEFNLLHLAIMWFVFPLLVTRGSGKGMGLNYRQLLQYPFSKKELFAAVLSRVTVMPLFWVLLIFSPVPLFALLFSPAPLPALTAGVLFIVSLPVFYWVLEAAGNFITLKSSFYRICLRLALLGLVFLNFSFNWKEQTFYVAVYRSNILLSDPGRLHGLLAGPLHWFPSSWVILAARGSWWCLPLFIPLFGVLLLFTWLLFRLQLNTGFEFSIPLVKKRSLFLSGLFSRLHRLPPLLSIELLKRLKSLEFLVSLLFSALTVYYTFTAASNIRNICTVFIPLVFLVTSGFIFNFLGTDAKSFTRYRLLPVSSKTILEAKNHCYFIVLALLLAPVFACLLATRPLFAMNLVFLSAAASLLYATAGNFTSVLLPAPVAGAMSGSREQAGGTLIMLYAVAVWVGLFFLYNAIKQPGQATAATGFTAVLCLVLYRVALPRSTLVFAGKTEAIQEQLG